MLIYCTGYSHTIYVSTTRKDSSQFSYCPYFSAWYIREICTSSGFISVSRSHCCSEFGFSRMCSNAVIHTFSISHYASMS